MALQRTFQGLEAELRPQGAARFGGAVFLTVWLLFWIAGEAFALWILGWGAWCLLTGQPPGQGRAPLETGPALAGGLFLLFWTAFWTFGGVLAWSEWLRRLFGRDRLIARPDSLEVIWGYGLFSTRKLLPRSDLTRFYIPRSANSGLSVETVHGPVPVLRFGGPAEIEQLAVAFNAEFGLTPEPRPEGILPDGWRTLTAPEGHVIFVADPVNRRRLAIALWIIFTPLALTAAYLAQATLTQGSLGAMAVIISAFALLAGWGAWRVSTQRDEWVLGRGEIALERRRRGRTARVFSGDALEVREDRDSDGDPGFKLMAVQTEARRQASLQTARQFERQVASRSDDPAVILGLGRWLAHRCQIPLIDQTTAEAKEEELTRLREKLAASGRLGAWSARLLGRMAERRKRQGKLPHP